MRNIFLRHCETVLSRQANQESNTHAQIFEHIQSKTLPPKIEEVLPKRSSGYAISPEVGRYIAHAVLDLKLHKVLEFGAGSSSLILSHALSVLGEGKLTSIEQNPNWCSEKWDRVKQITTVNSKLISSQPCLTLGKVGLHFIFKNAASTISDRGPYNFVFVDAPQGFYRRDGALNLVHQHLEKNALIILDDAGRNSEKLTIYRWLLTYPGLNLVYFDPMLGGRGIAVLQYNGDKRTRFSLISYISSLLDGSTRIVKKNKTITFLGIYL